MAYIKKICTKCKIEKTNFYKCKKHMDGFMYKCKDCDDIDCLKRGRTERGLISKIYSTQSRKSKTRGHKKQSYTRDQLSDWMYVNGFKLLYEKWVNSGYKTNLRPSVDRIKEDKGYCFNNIQLVTWYENKTKPKQALCIPVVQLLKGRVINSFSSTAEAGRLTKAYQGHISNCLLGKRKSAGGFEWKYLLETNIEE